MVNPESWKKKTLQNLGIQGKQMTYILREREKKTKIKSWQFSSFLPTLYYILIGQHWVQRCNRKKRKLLKCQFKFKIQYNSNQVSRTYSKQKRREKHKAYVFSYCQREKNTRMLKSQVKQAIFFKVLERMKATSVWTANGTEKLSDGTNMGHP